MSPGTWAATPREARHPHAVGLRRGGVVALVSDKRTLQQEYAAPVS